MLQKVVRSTVIDAPIERVWDVLRDFNSHDQWHDVVDRSRIEGGSPSDRVGCVRRFTSFYESFPTPVAFDLANNGVTLIPAGGSYIVTLGASLLPVGTVQSPPTALALGDNSEVTVPLTTGSFLGLNGPWTALSVISNGVVSQAAGNSLTAIPSPNRARKRPTSWGVSPISGTSTSTCLPRSSTVRVAPRKTSVLPLPVTPNSR